MKCHSRHPTFVHHFSQLIYCSIFFILFHLPLWTLCLGAFVRNLRLLNFFSFPALSSALPTVQKAWTLLIIPGLRLFSWSSPAFPAPQRLCVNSSRINFLLLRLSISLPFAPSRIYLWFKRRELISSLFFSLSFVPCSFSSPSSSVPFVPWRLRENSSRFSVLF